MCLITYHFFDIFDMVRSGSLEGKENKSEELVEAISLQALLEADSI